MLVFVDESGDPGMKLDRGSSEFFTVSAILFEDHEEADACEAGIDDLRTILKWPKHREFHFNSHSAFIRETFLQYAVQFGFFYLSVILNKRLLAGPGFQVKESLVKYTSRLVFENAKPYLNDAIVVIDGSSSKEFRSQMSAYLKKRINVLGGTRLIKKVKLQDSHSNNLIQLADMICGAVHRSVARGNFDFRRLIAARELLVQVWPKE